MSAAKDTAATETRIRNVERAIDAAIRQLIADEDPEAFETRKSIPGASDAWGERRHPLALPRIEMTHLFAKLARKEEKAAIAHARGRGHTWTEIGKALGEKFTAQAKRHEISLAVAAWEYAQYGVMPGDEISYRGFSMMENSFAWRCWDCTKTVYESHPEMGMGREAQQGHAPGCHRPRKK